MSVSPHDFELRSHGGGSVEEEHEFPPLGLLCMSPRIDVEVLESLHLVIGALVEGEILLVAVHPWQERMIGMECFLFPQRF